MIFFLCSLTRHSLNAMPRTIRLTDHAVFGIRRGRDENCNAFAGVRNVQPLKRRGSRWFQPDCDRVFYTPTHWRHRVLQ